MACIGHLDFTSSGLYDLRVTIDPEIEEFEIHLGRYFEDSETTCELLETGLSFSGINGYLFDQSGNFFGGYTPNEEFSIQIHKKNYFDFSYSSGGVLMNNDVVSDTMQLTAIKFNDVGNSKLTGQVKSPEYGFVAAGTFGEFLQDNLDNHLYSSDNILLISSL